MRDSMLRAALLAFSFIAMMVTASSVFAQGVMASAPQNTRQYAPYDAPNFQIDNSNIQS